MDAPRASGSERNDSMVIPSRFAVACGRNWFQLSAAEGQGLEYFRGIERIRGGISGGLPRLYVLNREERPGVFYPDCRTVTSVADQGKTPQDFMGAVAAVSR